MVRIRFEQPSYSVREDVGEVEVCLIKEPDTADPVTIDNVSTVDGSATGIQQCFNLIRPLLRNPDVHTTIL